MKFELKQLFDKKGKIDSEMRASYAAVREREGGIATKEEREKFIAWDAELVGIQEQIDFHQRMEKLNLQTEAAAGVTRESGENKEKKFNENATALERRNAMDKAKKNGYTALSDNERVILDTDVRDVKVFEKFCRVGKENLDAEEQRILSLYKSQEKRAQSVGTTTAGGYTVPEGFSGYIVEAMAMVSNLLNWADIIRTETGNTIPFPINDDNGNTGELIGENSDISSSSADLVFSVYNMGSYKMSSKLIKVSAELLQDNGVNLAAYLGKKLGIRVGKISNSYYTTGTGSAQPKGFLQTRGKVTASTSTFTQAEMMALQDSIDPAYANNAKVAWAFHNNILSEIKQIALGVNYNTNIWIPSFRDGAPDRILGKPYFINQAMSSTSATADKIMAYGDWDAFKVRIVNGFDLRRLTERYAEFDQVAFFGLSRTDSALLDVTALKYMDIS